MLNGMKNISLNLIGLCSFLVLAGCNTHTNQYSLPCDKVGTSVTPVHVSYGPKWRTCKPDWPGYRSKKSVTVEVESGSPVYALTDMTLVRIKNLYSKIKRGRSPNDDIHLFFETADGSSYRYYHLKKSHLAPTCKIWDTFKEADRSGYDHTYECGGEKGVKVKKGELLGYSGATGSHGHFDIIFKPMINGRRQIVQGDIFFEWECGTKDPQKFHMPFECK